MRSPDFLLATKVEAMVLITANLKKLKEWKIRK